MKTLKSREKKALSRDVGTQEEHHGGFPRFSFSPPMF